MRVSGDDKLVFSVFLYISDQSGELRVGRQHIDVLRCH